jgi:hypothetical protein
MSARVAQLVERVTSMIIPKSGIILSHHEVVSSSLAAGIFFFISNTPFSVQLFCPF